MGSRIPIESITGSHFPSGSHQFEFLIFFAFIKGLIVSFDILVVRITLS
jgi:hypothetical protein